MTAMRLIHQLASRHVGAIRQTEQWAGVTASGNPDDFIPEEFIDEFESLGDFLWAEFSRTLPFLIKPSIVDFAVLEAREKYRDLIRLLISSDIVKSPVMGEFIASAQVQYGDIRPLLVALGGGATDPTVQLQGGIGSGLIFHDAARDNGVDLGDEKIWLYGAEEQPRRTFNGHLQMDGLVFTNWNDDALRISPQDHWIRVSHYFPGDHWGCSCIVAPYVPNMTDQEIRINFEALVPPWTV